jgi:hypothetical protein
MLVLHGGRVFLAWHAHLNSYQVNTKWHARLFTGTCYRDCSVV